MLAIKVLSLVTYYNGTPHFAKEGKEKTLQSRKGCNAYSYLFSFSDSLFVLIFDFCNFLCGSGYNPYSLTAHTIKQSVKLPPLR